MKLGHFLKSGISKLQGKLKVSKKKKTAKNFNANSQVVKADTILSQRKTHPKNSLQTVSGNQSGQKILMFGWELPPFNSGGLGTACYHLANSLSKAGSRITFVLPKKDGAKAPFEIVYPENYGLSIIEVNSNLRPYLTAEEYYKICEEGDENSAVFYGKDLMHEVLRYGAVAAKIAKKVDFDVIHAHDWLSFPAGIKAKEVSKKPFIAHVHAIEHDRSYGLNEAICAIEKEGLEKADKIIANSGYTKSRIVYFYGINPDKIEVVHNGIVASRAKFEKLNFEKLKERGYKVVLFVGRITYQKGLDYLIKAAKKVLEANSKVYFVVAGSGDMEYQMIELAASLGIADKVLFAGFLRGEALERTYQSADLFVMPSVSEPYGIVALEALINGAPILVSKQSGVSESIQNALKVDFWDVDKMSEMILSVINDEDYSKKLAEDGGVEAEAQTWDKAAEKCISVYSSLA